MIEATLPLQAQLLKVGIRLSKRYCLTHSKPGGLLPLAVPEIEIHGVQSDIIQVY